MENYTIDIVYQNTVSKFRLLNTYKSLKNTRLKDLFREQSCNELKTKLFE